jgi:4-hydroxy-tetrahydrodipicolinate synthase
VVKEMTKRRLELGGVLPATVLPFREDYSIDEAAFRGLIRWLVGVPGVTGIVVNGVAGESSALEAEEQARVVSLAVAEVAGRVPVISGISAETARQAAKLATAAREAGAVAVLVQAPATFARGIALAAEVPLGYFRELAQAGVPMVLFQHQAGSGRAYPLPLLLRLLEIEQIVAVKETIWEAERYEQEVRAIRAQRPDVTVFCANDTILLASQAVAPADGLLVGFASLVPELIVGLWRALERNDLAAARGINDRLAALTEATYAAPPINYYPRMKAALRLLGRLPNAVVRPPLVPSGSAEVEVIRRALSAGQLLPEALGGEAAAE